jgi:SEC-C motif-containing protein
MRCGGIGAFARVFNALWYRFAKPGPMGTWVPAQQRTARALRSIRDTRQERRVIQGTLRARTRNLLTAIVNSPVTTFSPQPARAIRPLSKIAALAIHGGVSCASSMNLKTSPAFSITRKRRNSYPSETQVRRGRRFVHGDVELFERLGRNDLCPCGSGRRFQGVLYEVGRL